MNRSKRVWFRSCGAYRIQRREKKISAKGQYFFFDPHWQNCWKNFIPKNTKFWFCAKFFIFTWLFCLKFGFMLFKLILFFYSRRKFRQKIKFFGNFFDFFWFFLSFWGQWQFTPKFSLLKNANQFFQIKTSRQYPPWGSIRIKWFLVKDFGKY